MPRWMTAWRTEQVTVRSPHPPATALRLVKDGIDARHRHSVSTSQADFVIIGVADQHGVRISAARPHIENSWRTTLRAEIVPDGSGSRLVGRLGWRPASVVFTVTTAAVLIGGWAFVTAGMVRAVFLGHSGTGALFMIGVVTAFAAFFAGLVAIGERMSRAETAHLRAWLADRLAADGASMGG